MPPTLRERYLGALLGLACGDAVGTTVEFMERGSFPPVTDMVGGGPFHLRPGQWTDDTSMALCLAESLIDREGFDPHDQMARYLNWWRWGYLSSTGRCFDIGGTVAQALARFEATGDPYAGSTHPRSAGNGSLMRLAPVVLFASPDPDAVRTCCIDSSRTTHAAPEAIESCVLFGEFLRRALSGAPKEALRAASGLQLEQEKLRTLAQGRYVEKSRDQIAGTGYCVQSLEAALWCFHRTETFEAAILEAANLGDDADTTAAITGQIAGAYYGSGAIPESWLEKLHLRIEIEEMAGELLRLAESAAPDRSIASD